MNEMKRYDDHDMNTNDTLTRHEHTCRTQTRGCPDTMHLKPCNARRGPFGPYNGLTKHMTLNNAITKGVLIENDGKWVVCCDFRGATERPEQFDTMIPAMRQQFGEGCEFVECKPRMGDKGQGITFLVQVDKDAPWCRQEAKGQDQEMRGKSGEGGEGDTAAGPTGPTMMHNWEAMEATGVMVDPKRADTEWGREMVYVLRMHPVGITTGPKTRALLMRIKVARVEREGMERGRPFVVCFDNFFHSHFQTRVQDILEPLIMKDKEQEQPRLGKVPGFEAVVGLTDGLELTANEDEVVVSLHDVLLGGAKLWDGSELK